MPMLTFRDLPYTSEYDPESLACTVCAHCGGEAREYAYGVNHDMAVYLLALAKFGEPAMLKQLRDDSGAKLENGPATNGARAHLWGIIKSIGDGGRGPWALTERGRRFMRGDENIPQYVIVMTGAAKNKGDPVRYAGALCSFTAALHTHASDDTFTRTSAEKAAARRAAKR